MSSADLPSGKPNNLNDGIDESEKACAEQVQQDGTPANARANARAMTRLNDSYCGICTTRYPEARGRKGNHICAVCSGEVALTTKAQRANHRQRPHVRLVCGTCKASGYTSHDTQSYTCQGCNETYGYSNFHPVDMRNFRCRPSGPLLCKACRSVKKCAACKRPYDATHAGGVRIRRGRICKMCISTGHMPKKYRLWRCATCHQPRHHGHRYRYVRVQNLSRQGAALRCKQCKTTTKAASSTLRATERRQCIR